MVGGEQHSGGRARDRVRAVELARHAGRGVGPAGGARRAAGLGAGTLAALTVLTGAELTRRRILRCAHPPLHTCIYQPDIHYKTLHQKYT